VPDCWDWFCDDHDGACLAAAVVTAAACYPEWTALVTCLPALYLWDTRFLAENPHCCSEWNWYYVDCGDKYGKPL
jgi:hypothetical protein